MKTCDFSLIVSMPSDRVGRLKFPGVFISFFLFSTVFSNDNFEMNNNHYSDMELHLMSYQDLRRLSILLQLPANIKKKYMISMIQAHQKGDGCMKNAIAKKIMEERKVKRLNSKKKQTKSYMLGSSINSQQIPTDLSVSTQHEIETRVSYVAHYSSKDDLSSEISRIIKQEAEVSRRNRSILQQPRKPTRKLSTVGRTEIMLPRNHSLTTPVRLMPQYERGYPAPNNYDSMPGLSTAKTHFQDINYNYYFHGEFSNAVMPTTSHEMYRSEPYWHTREVYNNSLMPILSNLLTPNSVTINSSSYASQYTSGSSVKGSATFQGVYENYIKSNSIIESQEFQSSVTNSSTLIVNNHHVLNEKNTNSYNLNRGDYLMTKSDVDFELSSGPNELNCHHCAKRDEAVVKSSNGGQGFLEFYPTRHTDQSSSPSSTYVLNSRETPPCNSYKTENKEMALSIPHRPFESPSLITFKAMEILEKDMTVHETPQDYESSCTEDEKLWEEADQGPKSIMERNHSEKESLTDGFPPTHSQGSNFSEVSDTPTNFSVDMETNDKLSKTNEKEIPSYAPNFSNFSRCRYTSGHNKYPETVTDSSKIGTLPSFLSTFCSNELYNRAYSVCKNSFTGTTETHLNPIMTCTYASQFSSHTNAQQTQVNNTGCETQVQRQWYYSYPETQLPFTMESAAYTAWNDYPNEMDNKMMAANNSHNVQVVKCRTHGCHYLYSVSNPCD